MGSTNPIAHNCKYFSSFAIAHQYIAHALDRHEEEHEIDSD